MVKQATKEELLDQSIVMSDAWNLLKKWAHIEKDDDAAWEEMLKEINECCQKHGNSQYAKDIMQAVIREVTRLSNNGTI